MDFVGEKTTAVIPNSEPKQGNPIERREVLLLALIWLVAFLFRTIPFLRAVFNQGKIYLDGYNDPYYHLRRIRLISEHWPHLPDFDPWLNHPEGAYSIWSPLFDWIPGTFAYLTTLNADMVAVFWPPVIGASNCVLLYLLLRRFYTMQVAAVGTLLFTLSWSGIMLSALAHVDHHVAEVFFQLLIYLLMLRATDTIESERPLPKSHSFILGLVIAASLLTWAGSLLFLVLLPIFFTLLILRPVQSNITSRLSRLNFNAFLIAALLCMPYALLNCWQGRAPLASHFLSLLHPTVCIIFAIGPLALNWAIRPFFDGEQKQGIIRLSVLLLTLLFVPLIPGLWENILDGMSFVSRGQSDWFLEIHEFLPMFTSYDVWHSTIYHIGYGMPLGVVVLLVTAARMIQKRSFEPFNVFLLLWGAHVIVLSIFQLRFTRWAVPFVAILPCIPLHEWRWLGTWPARLCTLVFLVLLLPAFSSPLRFEPIPFQVFNFLKRIQATTPPSDPLSLDKPAEYGIMAPWYLGHWIIAVAERPVVASPFGTHLTGCGYDDSKRFYENISDSKSALSLLETRRCRYLITGSMARKEDRKTADLNIFANRLHKGNGNDLAGYPGTGRLRLFTITRGFVLDGQPALKLFELVQGAELRFVNTGRRELHLQTVVQSESGEFEYKRRVEPIPDGRDATVRLAYPGTYQILEKNKELGQILIEERAILHGLQFEVDITAPHVTNTTTLEERPDH